MFYWGYLLWFNGAMRRRVFILYGLLWGLYILLSFFLFPALNTSVFLISIPLVGLGGWIFGSSGGLFIVIFSILYHGILYSVIYAGGFDYYQGKLSGSLICIFAAMLTGHLKQTFQKLKQLHESLDQAVHDRNDELDQLTEKLIINAEHRRNTLGQNLHDGIGQYVTGLLLYSSSLEHRLKEEEKPLGKLASTLANQAKNTNNLIRKFARTLFPIKLVETGLGPALDELASSFEDIYSLSVEIRMDDLDQIPEAISLQFYRVCQEVISNAFVCESTDHVMIQLKTNPHKYRLLIEYNNQSSKQPSLKTSVAGKLLEYRVGLINGILTEHVITNKKTCLTCEVSL